MGNILDCVRLNNKECDELAVSHEYQDTTHTSVDASNKSISISSQNFQSSNNIFTEDTQCTAEYCNILCADCESIKCLKQFLPTNQQWRNVLKFGNTCTFTQINHDIINDVQLDNFNCMKIQLFMVHSSNIIKQEVLSIIEEYRFDLTMQKTQHMFYDCYTFHKYTTESAGKFGNEEWTKGEEITLQQLLYVKLYIDYDDIKLNCHQLRYFSSKILMLVSKFGCSRFGTNKTHDNMQLYLIENSQMVLNSQNKSFYCPLSTTTSHTMANILEENGVIVKKVKPTFPYSNYCKALDVRNISDDPDEQEWIIGFMYSDTADIQTWTPHEQISVLQN